MGKKRRFIKSSAMAMATMMMLSMEAPAFAAGETYNATTNGTNAIIFEKYLSMDKEANVPNVTFNYTIKAGTAQNANVDNQTMQIYAGSDANLTNGKMPTIAADQAAFKTGDTTYDTVQNSSSNLQSNHADGDGNAVKDNLTLGENEKYARKEIKVDFSQVQFKEPGIYRYVVTETASSEYYKSHGITDDSDSTRILDVYVIDDGVDENNKPKLKIQGYVLHNTEEGAAVLANGSSQQDTKADGFWNKYETENLTLSKKVEGNQASRDEYFEFTVKISDAVAGTKYDVIGNFDTVTQKNGINTLTHENPISITVPEGKTEVTQTFWLQNGQSITINGLSKNTSYSINENAATISNEGYTPTAAVTGDTKTGANEANDISMVALNAETNKTMVSDDNITEDTSVAYTNTKKGVIPTGVILTIAPFAAVTLLGGAGIATVLMRRKREEDTEESN